jgi:hypothetical protein
VRLATDLHLVPLLIMNVAVPPFHLVCSVTTELIPLPYFEFHISLFKDKKILYGFCLMAEASDHGYVLHTRRIHVTHYNVVRVGYIFFSNE